MIELLLFACKREPIPEHLDAIDANQGAVATHILFIAGLLVVSLGLLVGCKGRGWKGTVLIAALLVLNPAVVIGDGGDCGSHMASAAWAWSVLACAGFAWHLREAWPRLVGGEEPPRSEE
ncbi:MAG: hypothetical protein K2W96_07680 [Gemmataceae bacterium]|nr:hypothetical protein [Gemmataceae bacterium]